MATMQGKTAPDDTDDTEGDEKAAESEEKSWSETLRDWMGHPLLLLLVGAIVTGLLVPSITHGWQTQQMGQDLKTKVIGEITDSSAATMSQLELTVLPEFGTTTSPSASAAQYQAWMQKGSSISSEIHAYFPDKNLPGHWGNYYGLMRNFYLYTYAHDPTTRASRLSQIKHYFDVHEVRDPGTWAALSGPDRSSDRYRQAWTTVEKLILGVRDTITAAIMDAPNPGF